MQYSKVLSLATLLVIPAQVLSYGSAFSTLKYDLKRDFNLLKNAFARPETKNWLLAGATALGGLCAYKWAQATKKAKDTAEHFGYQDTMEKFNTDLVGLLDRYRAELTLLKTGDTPENIQLLREHLAMKVKDNFPRSLENLAAQIYKDLEKVETNHYYDSPYVYNYNGPWALIECQKEMFSKKMKSLLTVLSNMWEQLQYAYVDYFKQEIEIIPLLAENPTLFKTKLDELICNKMSTSSLYPYTDYLKALNTSWYTVKYLSQTLAYGKLYDQKIRFNFSTNYMGHEKLKETLEKIRETILHSHQYKAELRDVKLKEEIEHSRVYYHHYSPAPYVASKHF